MQMSYKVILICCGVVLQYASYTMPCALLFIVIIKSISSLALFCVTLCHTIPPTVQLPVGAGFSRNADRPRTHHGFLHRGNAWRHRRSHPRQRFSGWPQEALQKAERIWKRIPQQVNTPAHFHNAIDDMHIDGYQISLGVCVLETQSGEVLWT